nr:phospholipase A [Caenibius tardaugens]
MSLWIGVAAMGIPVSTAHAASPVEVLISDAGQRDQDGHVLVELRLLNGCHAPQTASLPDRIEARIAALGNARVIWLERAPGTPADRVIAPGGFGRTTYRIAGDTDEALDGASLSIPAWNTRQIALAVRSAPIAPIAKDESSFAVTSSVVAPIATPPPSDRSAGNAFLANLSAYEPIYAVYGPGTDADARIQISFKYQIFGTRRASSELRSWRDGLHFAYTQRMFWDLGADSSPFRNIDFQPELFYLTPPTTLANGISLAGQGGVRHESNGRSGAASRSFNTIYLAPMAAIPLSGRYRLSVSPRLSFYVGDLSDNPDIRRYRGNLSLYVELGEDDGLRLSTATRFNFSSGKGALNATLSYPLSRILGGGPDFYLFGQGFTGYGENLLDYNRRTTRFRLGLALVR